MKQSKTPIISFSPIVLPVHGRHAELEIKVSAPATGNNPPVYLGDMLRSLTGQNTHQHIHKSPD